MTPKVGPRGPSFPKLPKLPDPAAPAKAFLQSLVDLRQQGDEAVNALDELSATMKETMEFAQETLKTRLKNPPLPKVPRP